MKTEIIKNFIVFEGLDGCGTTTQCRLLSSRLKQAYFTFEPTGHAIGTLARQVLKKEIKISSLALAYLFSADRAEHLYGKNGIISQCRQGKTAVCDRYLFSSIAYQSIHSGFERVMKLNQDFPLPETVFFLDTDIQTCLQRITERGQLELFDKKELLIKVKKNYQKVFDYYAKRLNLVVINGNQTIEEIAAKVVSYL